jgi:peptidyl-prolyl cis-trans isomerase-like 2
MFEFEHLFSFVRKHKRNPVTANPMTTADIIKLNMAKNPDGLWHCPVTFKVFNNNTHIVAIRPTGHVYAYEAVQELNIKANNYTDLLTGETFHRSDIITLQNPDDAAHIALRDINNFKYLQTMRDDAATADRTSAQSDRIRHNTTAERVLKEYEKNKKENLERLTAITSASAAVTSNSQDLTEDVAAILDLQPTTEDVNPGHMMLDQRTSRSLTSTSFDVHTESKMRTATADEIREARWRHMRQVTSFFLLNSSFPHTLYLLYSSLCFLVDAQLGKKGYVQLQTNYGSLNLEIHCDWSGPFLKSLS